MPEKLSNMNKKALSHHWLFMIIGFLAGLGMFFYHYAVTKQLVPGEYLGDAQLELMKSLQKGDDVLLYIDQSAKFSSSQSIYDLAGNGGFYNKENCGKHLGYNFWRTEAKKTDECFPDYKENFGAAFNENLNKYLKNYRGISITNNYAVQLKDKSIIGIANSDVKVPISILSPEKKNFVTGAYYIKPSFNVNVNYDFDDYPEIKEISHTVAQCLKSNDVGICLNIANGIDDKFDWSLGCDKGAEKILYDFAEFYQGCMDLEDTNCLCKKNLELSKEQINDLGLAGNVYELNLKEDALNKKIRLKAKDMDLHYDVGFKGDGGLFPEKYILTYTQDGQFDLNMIFINNITTKELGSLGPLKEITIYRNERDGRKYADFVKEGSDEIEYPVSERNTKKPEGLHECKLKPKNTYKFCVTKKDFKLTAYDTADNKVKERDLMYKFALVLPKAETTSGLE